MPTQKMILKRLDSIRPPPGLALAARVDGRSGSGMQLAAVRPLATGLRPHTARGAGWDETQVFGVPGGFGRAGHEQHLHPEGS